MYWTLELASKLEDAPWPATKDELIDYAIRSGAPLEVLENLQEIEDEGDVYESIDDIWPDYPTKEDFLFNNGRQVLKICLPLFCLILIQNKFAYFQQVVVQKTFFFAYF